MPQIGLDGQSRICAARIAVVGGRRANHRPLQLDCEAVSRALAAAGVGALRLICSEGGWPDDLAAALRGSNPTLQLDARVWPADGAGWLEALEGTTAVARSGFDDDPMMRAATRLGLPVVVMRGRNDRVDLLSFRRNGPCPHASLDVPAKHAEPSDGGAAAVLAGELAAAEVLVIVAQATVGEAPARRLTVPLAEGTAVAATAADIPWSPRCFACGGDATEMSFA